MQVEICRSVSATVSVTCILFLLTVGYKEVRKKRKLPRCVSRFHASRSCSFSRLPAESHQIMQMDSDIRIFCQAFHDSFPISNKARKRLGGRKKYIFANISRQVTKILTIYFAQCVQKKFTDFEKNSLVSELSQVN